MNIKTIHTKNWGRLFVVSVLVGLMAACGGSPSNENGSAVAAEGRHTIIHPGPNASSEAVTAFVSAAPGDTIEFACGFFDISSTLLLTHVEDVTVKGCGRDKTVLSFKNNNAPEGILTDNARGIRVFDLTVADTDGNGFEIRTTDHVTLRNVRAFWSSDGGRTSANAISASDADESGSFASVLNVACTDPATQNPNVPENAGGDTSSPDYTVSDHAGRYGIYPVKSRNVLVEQAESVGASDAGIYVGQSSNIIIRDSRAVYNVFGFEIENVQHGIYENNISECNTGGFLIYDLDGLTQYGSRTIMRNNIARMNNTYNFTEGGFVANVPPGSGMITLSYDRIDVYNNVFEDNNTGGIIHVSYELFPEGAGRPVGDRKIDYYTEGVHIFNNTFKNNGNGLPTASTADLANQDVARLLPALVGLKSAAGGEGYRGAHILWDGLMDEKDGSCDYPTKADGTTPVDESSSLEGKPDYQGEDPNPECRYNAYKFDDAGNRKTPDWWFTCIDADNTFSDDSLRYANFHGTKGIDAALALATFSTDDPNFEALINPNNVTSLSEFPSTFEMQEHACVQRFGSNLERIPDVVIPEFERTGEYDQGVSGNVDELCNASVAEGSVNFNAYTVDCPLLQNYNLFADPEDPTSTPNSNGTPFVLNTKLFSDYSVKYRVAYLPPGTRATYVDSGDGNAPNAAIVFPEGTIIAKTFSFLDNGVEDAVETRLIIKRRQQSGAAVWAGLPYIWETDSETGERIARLQKAGGQAMVSWNYTDADSGRNNVGSTDVYAIPTASQCLTCHSNEDAEGGSAPIGPKVRNLNRVYSSESSVASDQSSHEVAGQNQIKYWCDNGLLAGCPSGLTVTDGIANVERIPKFNVPGDSGLADASADKEARVRAWLEVNCLHCHNPRVFAANSGFYLDVFRAVDQSYGVCKGVTAAGAEGTDGRQFDIVPTSPDDSVLEYRISAASNGSPAARMPPIARSVNDIEAHALVRDWIQNVVVGDNSKYPNSESCAP